MASSKRRMQSVSISLDLPGLRGCFFVWPRVPLIVLAIVILVGGFYFARRSGNDPKIYSNDFNVFYHAASEVLAGRDPYQSSLGEWTPYLYPPLLAVVLAPLALLPLPAAGYVWFLINAVSTIAAGWIPARLACDHLRPWERRHSCLHGVELEEAPRDACAPWFRVTLIAAASLFVVVRFAFDNFNIGQVNPLIAGLVAAHVFFYAKNRKFASALALAIAASIKLAPILFIAYHLARRRLRFAAACAGMVAGITTLSFLPLGTQAPDAARVFVNRTIRNEQGFDLAYAGNQSVRGAVARLFANSVSESSHDTSDTITLLVSLVMLGAALVAASCATDELHAAAPMVCCLVLLSPLAWKANFVVLILPIASLISEALHSASRRRSLAIAYALTGVFVLFNLTSPHVIGLAASEWADAHSLVLAGALLVFILSVGSAMTGKFGKHRRVC